MHQVGMDEDIRDQSRVAPIPYIDHAAIACMADLPPQRSLLRSGRKERGSHDNRNNAEQSRQEWCASNSILRRVARLAEIEVIGHSLWYFLRYWRTSDRFL